MADPVRDRSSNPPMPLSRRGLIAAGLALGTAVSLRSNAQQPAAAASPQPEPSPSDNVTGFELAFELHARGLVIGNTTLSLTRRDDRYLYRSTSGATGLAAMIRNDRIDERSEFELVDGALRSHRYSYHRVRGEKTREVLVEFDWAEGQVRNTAEGRTWRMAVPDGTLDKLNYMLVLMHDLRIGRRPLNYPVADGGKLKTFSLTPKGEETIETVDGPSETVLVERSRKNATRVTTLWCSRKLGFAPVKIEHREPDGNELVLKLVRISGDVKTPVAASSESVS